LKSRKTNLAADAGILPGVRYVASPNCDERPDGAKATLLVVHCISLPPGQFGGDAIERLFTNRLDPAAHPYFREIAALRVSAHFLVRRDGELVQFVPLERRAWHAGASSWRGRQRCNDYSLGVELEGCEDQPYEPGQYEQLARLVRKLRPLLQARSGRCVRLAAPAARPGVTLNLVGLRSSRPDMVLQRRIAPRAAYVTTRYSKDETIYPLFSVARLQKFLGLCRLATRTSQRMPQPH
jgi:AmpD protein